MKYSIKITYDIENQYRSERLQPMEIEVPMDSKDEVEALEFLDDSGILKPLINDTILNLNKSTGLDSDGSEWESDDSLDLNDMLSEILDTEIYQIYLNTQNSNFVIVETDEGLILMYEVAPNSWKVLYEFVGDFYSWDVYYNILDYKIKFCDK